MVFQGRLAIPPPPSSPASAFQKKHPQASVQNLCKEKRRQRDAPSFMKTRYLKVCAFHVRPLLAFGKMPGELTNNPPGLPSNPGKKPMNP
jgi:hypothetical protein